MIEIYFDGACEPNNPKGIATYGFVIYRDGEKLNEGKGLACEPFSYQASNNVAEYTAMIKALEFIIEIGLTKEEITIHGDSQLAIRQMTGWYSVNAERIIPLYKKACELARQFKKLQFQWVPREENGEADDLSHQAYEEYIEAHPDIREKVIAVGATPKQKAFMNRLDIKHDKYISKREASRLISRKLDKK